MADAQRRFDTALARLEESLTARAPVPDAQQSFDFAALSQDRDTLVVELGAARQREQALEEAAALASAALGRAAAEVRAALAANPSEEEAA